MPREHNNSSDMGPLAANCTRFYHVLQKQGLPATLQTQVLLQPLDGGEIIASQWAECGRLPWRPGLAGGSGAAPFNSATCFLVLCASGGLQGWLRTLAGLEDLEERVSELAGQDLRAQSGPCRRWGN